MENHPTDFPRETESRAPGVRRYADTLHWDQLATVYLSRYTLPPWASAYDGAAATIWLDRLDLPLRDWLATGNYRTPEDFAILNPRWPLRAAIGLMLELRHEHAGAR